MRNFLRGVRNSWPYRIRLFLSVAFAILAAVFWSLNFLAIHPAMKILGGAESLAKSVDKDIGDVEHDAVEPNKRLDDLRNEIQVIERWQDGPEKERKRPVRIARKLCVVGITLGDGEMFQCVRVLVVGK